MNQERRTRYMRALRMIAGGVTQFEDGKSKLYFRQGDLTPVDSKLKELFGQPIHTKPNETVWWSDELTCHVKMVTFKRDVVVIIPKVGNEVKGAFV